MTQYFLQLKYKGKVVYRKESLQRLSITDVVLEDGIIENRRDIISSVEKEDT